jgi:hypothetical protein
MKVLIAEDNGEETGRQEDGGEKDVRLLLNYRFVVRGLRFAVNKEYRITDNR